MTGQTASDSNFSYPGFTPGSSFWKNILESECKNEHNYFNFSMPDQKTQKVIFN